MGQHRSKPGVPNQPRMTKVKEDKDGRRGWTAGPEVMEKTESSLDTWAYASTPGWPLSRKAGHTKQGRIPRFCPIHSGSRFQHAAFLDHVHVCTHMGV